MPIKIEKLSLNLPFGLGGVELVNEESQQLVAWELYVEYSTRITTQKLDKNTGSIREALNSLHSLFATTRSVLKDKGPGTISSENSVGVIAIRILNEGIRPFLSKWHCKLSKYENEQSAALNQGTAPGVVADKNLSDWKYQDDFYQELETFQQELLALVDVLATIAGVSFKTRTV